LLARIKDIWLDKEQRSLRKKLFVSRLLQTSSSGEELTEEERYRVADDVVHRLKQHGGPWRLSEDLPPPGKGHSTQ
jgi:hypothetical protein